MAVKRPALADFSVTGSPSTPAPEPKKAGRPKQSKLSSDKDNKLTSVQAGKSESAGRVQVAFRIDKDAYKDLKRMALDEDTTVNELVVRAINELRQRKGLKKIAG